MPRPVYAYACTRAEKLVRSGRDQPRYKIMASSSTYHLSGLHQKVVHHEALATSFDKDRAVISYIQMYH
jgi:hypothetical protein